MGVHSFSNIKIVKKSTQARAVKKELSTLQDLPFFTIQGFEATGLNNIVDVPFAPGPLTSELAQLLKLDNITDDERELIKEMNTDLAFRDEIVSLFYLLRDDEHITDKYMGFFPGSEFSKMFQRVNNLGLIETVPKRTRTWYLASKRGKEFMNVAYLMIHTKFDKSQIAERRPQPLTPYDHMDYLEINDKTVGYNIGPVRYAGDNGEQITFMDFDYGKAKRKIPAFISKGNPKHNKIISDTMNLFQKQPLVHAQPKFFQKNYRGFGKIIFVPTDESKQPTDQRTGYVIDNRTYSYFTKIYGDDITMAVPEEPQKLSTGEINYFPTVVLLKDNKMIGMTRAQFLETTPEKTKKFVYLLKTNSKKLFTYQYQFLSEMSLLCDDLFLK